MPTYTGPGLLAGPYWDAFEPDPANAFSPDNDASQGVLGTLPAWATPMTPAQPRTDFLPWPGLMPIDQAPNDFGPLLPPGLRKPPWWFRPAPSMPPLLPPWAYPPPDVPRLPPLMPDYRPEPLPQLRVDDPLEMVRFGAAFSDDTSAPWAQRFDRPSNPFGSETLPDPGPTAGLLGIPRTLPFQTGPYDRDFAASVVPTTSSVRDSVDALSALAAIDRGEPSTWAALSLPTSGVLDPTGLTYGSQSIATQAAYEGEPSNDSGSESEAGSGANDKMGEPDGETGSSDRDQDNPNLAQAPNNKQQPPQRRPAPPPPSMSAVRTGRDQIIIASEDGTVEVRTGGTPAWRNNNPGNLWCGDFAKENGAIGKAGKFAVFPNEATGREAAIKRLGTGVYQTFTLDGAVKEWAPKHENNTAKYQEFVRQQLGLEGNTPMSALTQPQLERLYEAIRRMERSTPGTVTRYGR